MVCRFLPTVLFPLAALAVGKPVASAAFLWSDELLARHQPMDTSGLDSALAQLLDNYYEATFGGIRNWETVQSVKFEGRLSLADGGKLDFVAFKKKPFYSKVVLTGPSGASFVMAYDGGEAWQLSTAGEQEPEPMPEAEALNFARDAGFSGHLAYPTLPGKRLRLLGARRVEGEVCYDIEVRLPNGQTVVYAIDASDYLQRQERTVNAVTGQEVVNTFYDIRRVAWPFPFARRARWMANWSARSSPTGSAPISA